MANFEINQHYYDPETVKLYEGWGDKPVSCVSVCGFPLFEATNDDGDSTLADPDELITDREEIKILFDYPLEVAASITFTNKGGFTRKDFFRAIYEGYKRIYEEEEAAAGDPGLIPGRFNRAKSNGPHGIWGHVMEDLAVEGVEDKGDGKYELMIGS